MFYGKILRTKPDKLEALEILRELPLDTVFEVIIKPFKRNRSNRQNAMLWAIYNQLSEQIGHDSDMLHVYFKSKFLGYQEAELFGETKRFTRSTKKLTTAEFADYLTKIMAFALEHGFVIARPYDWDEVFR